MGWMGNEGVDINRGVSPVSSPVTVLSHGGEFQKSKVGVIKAVWFNLVQFGIVSYTKPHKTTPTLRQNYTVYIKLHQRINFIYQSTLTTPNNTKYTKLQQLR